MRAKANKIGALILSVILIFSLGLSVFAIDQEDVRDSDNPLIVFENLKEPQPDLYVTKTVTSALDGYSVPSDATFTFVLKWDQDGDGYLEFADSVNYFVYKLNGTQVWNDLTSDGSFQTSSTGRFTLQDGQYAYFEFAGTVDYEITELEQDGYTQTVPSGGQAATGTIDAEGTFVDFENIYIPEIQNAETTMLAIRKDIAFPEGYEESDISAEFTFSIKLDSEWYGNQPYCIYDEDMTNIIEQRTSESDGTFTVPINCTAVFDDVEVGIDYQIAEIDADGDGWQVVGTTEYHGSTVGPIVYMYFTNEPTYLVVEKQRTDGIVGIDDTFTFTLTNSSDNIVTGTDYYVYDSDGNLARTGTTDENGKFALKAGEKAMFLGLDEGSEYTVTEDSYEGYNTDTAKTGTAEFENEDAILLENEQLSNLTVKKYDGNTGTTLLGGAEFAVYTLKDGKDVDSATDDDWELYIESITTNDDETSENYGTFTITNLQPGTYKVIETQAPEGYTISGEPIVVTLPYTMTKEEAVEERVNTESSEFTGIWSDRDNCYYFYDLTYDVYNNMSLLELPNAASRTLWPFIAIGACVVILAVCGTIYYRKKCRPIKAEYEGRRISHE